MYLLVSLCAFVAVNTETVSIFAFDLKAAFFALIGFVLNQIWSAFRARRIDVPWTATFQKINPQTPFVTATDVQVLVGGTPCNNLLSCQVQLRNESSRDIESLDILFTFIEPFQVIEGHGGLASSAKAALFSEDFQKTIKVVRELPEEERKKHTSYPYLGRNREFNLPSLNRSEVANFNFWINANDPKALAEILVTTEKSGVRLISRRANFQPLDVALLKASLPFGLILAALAVVAITRLDLSPITLALLSCAIGAGTGFLGLAALFFVRAMKKLV